MKCPKCSKEMEEGIIVDSVYAGVAKGRWASKITLGGLSTNNSKTIKSFRCKNCGYLENYAKDKGE